MSIRIIQFIRRLYYYFLSDNKINGSPIISQPIFCSGYGSIDISNDSRIGYPKSPKFLSTYAYIEARKKNSKIIINSNTTINNGVTIIAYRDKISIGSNCLIGVDVQIMNTDFHKIDSKDRFNNKEPSSAPIEIGNNVFIGNNVTILKGVRIGNGVTIANGSIVRSSIPENSIYNEHKEIRLTEIIS